MLVCKRCQKVGLETDGAVYERQGRNWMLTSKTFSNPSGFICDRCLAGEPIPDKWDEAQELLDKGE